MPVESARKVARQATWLAALNAHPDTAALRGDAHRNLVAVAWAVASWSDWDSGASRPTWEQLAKQTGLKRRTVAKWLAWLRERGLLAVLERGTTPRYRDRFLRAVLGPRAGNRAALYRLTVPDEVSGTISDLGVDETCTPSCVPRSARDQNAHAHEARSPLRGVDESVTPFELRRCPRTRTERLAACERLRAESPTLRRVSARRLRHLLRPWLLAGWTVRGVQHALDHRPDGTPWRIPFRPDELRNPSGWVVHRMRAWADADGAPLPDPFAATGPRGHAESRSEDDRSTPTILVAAVGVCEHGDSAELLWNGTPRCPLCRYRAERSIPA